MLKDVYKPESFDYEEIYNNIKRDWTFNAAKTGAKKFVIGISGGKDSSVAAALAVKIFGKEYVLGVLMPNGEQSDIEDSLDLVQLLDIDSVTINIKGAVDSILNAVENEFPTISEDTMINLPARIRMSTLFAVAQSYGGRVINTCNLSENLVGYSTLFGDDVGVYAPLAGLTATEVMYLGQWLGLPDKLTFKIPSDGLCGKTDEAKLGFTYFELDCYYRTGYFEDWKRVQKMNSLNKKNFFKRELVKIPTPWINRELLGGHKRNQGTLV